MSLLPHLLLLLLLTRLSTSARPFLRTLPEVNGLYCDSWRFSVETNDAGSWAKVPYRCAGYVADYMSGLRYLSDSEVVAGEALEFAVGTATYGLERKAAWVFDVDETLLSNVPYYAVNGYGSEVFNEKKFDEWVEKAEAPAITASLRLYNELKLLGFRLVLLTGRSEEQRKATEKNLRYSGYSSWERLILRNASDIGKTAVAYKSERRALLQSEGFKIYGSSGDQWSDLFGWPVATRSFKLPNPMYYIA